MKQLAKTAVACVANVINEMLGYRFPDYFCERDRVQVLLFGIEPDVSRTLKKKLRRGMTVLDVGGNVGLICRICAKQVGPEGHVRAFEPDPYNRGFLEHNVRKCSNVSVSSIALSDENAVAKLHIHPGSGTANSILEFDASSHAIEVQCMTLDSYLAENPDLKPDCIKIDVEGAEPKVLAGMKETIKRFPSLFLLIEFCPQNLANGGYSPKDYFRSLEDLGLVSEVIHDDGSSSPVPNLDTLLAMLGNRVYCNLLCFTKR